MIAFAVELHLFQSSDVLELPETLQKLELEALEYWRLFDSFLKMDYKMPTKLREHFLNLESHMIRFLCWVEGSSIVKVLKDI